MSKALSLLKAVKKNRLNSNEDTLEPLDKDLAALKFKNLPYAGQRPEQNVAQLDTDRQRQIASKALGAKWRRLSGVSKGSAADKQTALTVDQSMSGGAGAGAVFSVDGHPNMMAVAHKTPQADTDKLDYQKHIATPHEGLHWNINEIEKKHGPHAARAVEQHLLQKLHPDDHDAVAEIVRGGYGGSAPNSEILTHSRDILRSPASRADISTIQSGGIKGLRAANARGVNAAKFENYDQNRHKAGHKQMVAAAAALTDADVQKLASDYQARQDRKRK